MATTVTNKKSNKDPSNDYDSIMRMKRVKIRDLFEYFDNVNYVRKNLP